MKSEIQFLQSKIEDQKADLKNLKNILENYKNKLNEFNEMKINFQVLQFNSEKKDKFIDELKMKNFEINKKFNENQYNNVRQRGWRNKRLSC